MIILFSESLKGLFYFTHTLITLIDQKSHTYFPFLFNNAASPISNQPQYPQLIKSHFSMDDPIFKAVLDADMPISFSLEDIMDKPQSPSFLRTNYEGGIREILITALRNADQPMGFIHIYSDRLGSFTNEFKM